MSVAIITGSCGLVGSEATKYFSKFGMKVLGIDNDMRKEFFGTSTLPIRDELLKLPGYTHANVDVRDSEEIDRILFHYRNEVSLVIHCAAQPSHDWAMRDPITDFHINATGTLNLLEATRINSRDAVFIFMSTNKVYGDLINHMTFVEYPNRFEPTIPGEIDEDFRIDRSLHSLFGVSKLSADFLVQEYGRYFGMKTVCFRAGCISGPGHAGAELHGFLSYLIKCAIEDKPYTIYGYKGKQVRDNLHACDLVSAFAEFHHAPRRGEVYNIGGGNESNCSVLEAISMCEQITGKKMKIEYRDEPRRGDHKWWISDTSKFKSHYPNWKITKNWTEILREIYEAKCVAQS